MHADGVTESRDVVHAGELNALLNRGHAIECHVHSADVTLVQVAHGILQTCKPANE